MITIKDGMFCIETEHTGYYMARRGCLVENLVSLLHLCLELSPIGKGDYRQGALELELGHEPEKAEEEKKKENGEKAEPIRQDNGCRVFDFQLDSTSVEKGCISPQGLPAAYLPLFQPVFYGF